MFIVEMPQCTGIPVEKMVMVIVPHVHMIKILQTQKKQGNPSFQTLTDSK